MFAVWALPRSQDFDYLVRIIKKLSKKYDFPFFSPHVTLYGLVDIDFRDLENIIVDSIIDIEPFTVKKEKITFSNNFWKSLFILIKQNKELDSIDSKLANKLERFSSYEFIPHFSLIYKNLEKDEKIKIIENLDIKNEFLIDKIGILEFSKDIHKWKIAKKFNF